MKMKMMFVLACMLLLPVGSSMAAGNAAGKKVFLDAKCNKCHSMKSEGIEKLPATADAGEAAEEGEKIDPPDLSKLDSRVASQPGGADAFLAKYLKKEAGLAPAAGGEPKKHKKLFAGTDADLQAVIQFLQGK